jgi:esterase/lipase superfamily enzyme
MELLLFGTGGRPVIVFPTSMGRFYQNEDFSLIHTLSDRLEGGALQMVCVDSVDSESWYADDRHPHDRVMRHLDYERYLVDELIPRMPSRPVTTGTSLGAFHALLLALRQPWHVTGFVALSGAYDTDRWLDGHHDDETYLTNPLAFLPGLTDERYLEAIRAFDKKVIATGRDDANAQESIQAGELLRAKGVDVWLDVWDGWVHDWPFWKDMIRRYV